MDEIDLECIAIIPARGGSKGVPRKNIHPLRGKPLIAYAIEQAQRARLVDRLVVSTDDTEIAAVSKNYGAEIVWRPEEISGDSASSESALLCTLEHLQKIENYNPDILAFIQCTSPLTVAEDIDGTIQALQEDGADSALAVTPFHYFLWKEQAGGEIVGINHNEQVRLLRQEREPQFLETGAVYTMRVPGFLQARHRFFGKTAIYIMPHERHLEIDEPVDFQIAEVLLRERSIKQKLNCIPVSVGALVLDFDGVFTNNKVIVFQDGREAVLCDRSDGWGIEQLKKNGLEVLVLSTETNPVVQARADKLGIPCLHGIKEKGVVLQDWMEKHNINPSQVIYVGNDVNDLTSMALVGCAIAVADAHPEVIEAADLILERNGGEGAIREVCDLILEHIRLSAKS
jgi:YrbI family 3-deoxy-D-manno-octulosonate 8-phosphate phosphatase